MSIKVRSAEEEKDFIAYPLVDVEQFEAHPAENLLDFAFCKDMLRILMGQTLTIIDASFSDKEQRKAVKDLVRQTYNDRLCFLSDMAFDQEKIQEHLPETIDEVPAPIEVDEALGVK